MDLIVELIDKVVNQVEEKLDIAIERRLGVFNGNINKPYMNKKEAAQYINVSFNTLQKFIDNGLPVIEVDGVKLLSKKDIDEFLEKNKQ